MPARELETEGDFSCCVASRVVSLTWTSSVGIAQHLAYKLVCRLRQDRTSRSREILRHWPGAAAKAKAEPCKFTLAILRHSGLQQHVMREQDMLSEGHFVTRAGYGLLFRRTELKL